MNPKVETTLLEFPQKTNMLFRNSLKLNAFSDSGGAQTPFRFSEKFFDPSKARSSPAKGGVRQDLFAKNFYDRSKEFRHQLIIRKHKSQETPATLPFTNKAISCYTCSIENIIRIKSTLLALSKSEYRSTPDLTLR
ncbi:MAG: hypothetical protein GTN76_13655 [Candidatus Aenigmarchaeota archaeon]|nr:hypothetical protein [Candidatus Aenigmarchaeota archaeon]